MLRLLKTLAAIYILNAAMFDMVNADRSAGEEQQDSRTVVDTMLKVENAYLKKEVDELRHELRVAASGSLIQKAESAQEEELLPSHKHRHKHHHQNNRHQGSALQSDGHRRFVGEEADGSQGKMSLDEQLIHGVMPKNRLEEETQDEEVISLSVDLMDISQAIAQDAAAVARKIEAARSVGEGWKVTNETHASSKAKAHEAHQEGSKVLFVIYSSAKFYNTRVRWMQNTWAKHLNSSQFVIIGDGQANDLPFGTNVNIHQTRCTPEDPTMLMCCKYAEAVVVAQSMMWQNPELQWAYMADDDSYIRAAALQENLLQQPLSRPRDRGLVLGNYGCVTSNCSDLLCGSSGYAANRWAIDIMAAGDPAGLVQEVMHNCKRCGGDAVYGKGVWGDAGLSEVLKDRGVERRKLEGIYGWMLDKSCLEFSLESENEPLLYHSIRTQQQMEMLHRLFAPVGEQTAVSPSSGSSAVDGLGGCVEFRGNVQCAASRAEEDRPWVRGPSLCQRPRMPRLPLLFGIFTLFLLFVIVSTFIWAGFRYQQQQWDGWKLESLTGLKWHSYPMQGRSRIR